MKTTLLITTLAGASLMIGQMPVSVPIPMGLKGATGANERFAAMRPDGITRRVETRRVDLSRCDTVKIEGPVHDLSISRGYYDAYWLKSSPSRLEITCEMEVPVK